MVLSWIFFSFEEVQQVSQVHQASPAQLVKMEIRVFQVLKVNELLAKQVTKSIILVLLIFFLFF